MRNYVYIKNEISIKKNLDEITLIVENKSKRRGEVLYKINEDAFNIISKLTGEYRIDEIIIKLAKYYNEDIIEIEKKLVDFLNVLKSKYGLLITESDEKINKKFIIEVVGENYYPNVVSIELTHKCNLKCLHCYGEYCVEDVKEANLSKLKKFLCDCKNAGIRIIELTGGELTMYPHIVEVLKFIYELDFNFVSLLSNGVIRNEELYNLIIEHKDKTIVQIDMHGNTEEYLTWFTKIPNIKETVEENIKYLNDNNVLMRVVTIVTPKNLNQILEIAEWVHQQGIKSYAISPVINLGRANSYMDELGISNLEDFNHFEKILSTITQKYEKEFLELIEDQRTLKENCGALTSNLSISPTGDIKICAMDGLDFTNSLGNVFEKNIMDIFDEKKDLILSYKNLTSPSPEREDCSICENVGFCGGCVLRGIIKGRLKGEKCRWYQETVPEIIKQDLVKI